MGMIALFIDLQDWPCLLAGGNEKILHQAQTLLEHGAKLSIWSKEFSSQFQQLAKQFPGQLSLVRGQLDGTMLTHILQSQLAPRFVFISTDDFDLDAELYKICETNFVPASVLGYHSRLAAATTIDRTALQVAVSVPAAMELEQVLARNLERAYPQDWHEGSLSYVQFRHSKEVEQMHLGVKEARLDELASALMECKGRYAAAEAKLERRGKTTL